MKVYRFDVRVVVPDDAIESALLDRVRAAVDVLAGDRLTEAAPGLAQAKAVLVAVEPGGTDPADHLAWARQACDAIAKADPTDRFTDSRMVGHEDSGAG